MAITIKPDYAEAYNNMGNALQDLGKLLKEAIDAFNKAIYLEPNCQAYGNMGNAQNRAN